MNQREPMNQHKLDKTENFLFFYSERRGRTEIYRKTSHGYKYFGWLDDSNDFYVSRIIPERRDFLRRCENEYY